MKTRTSKFVTALLLSCGLLAIGCGGSDFDPAFAEGKYLDAAEVEQVEMDDSTLHESDMLHLLQMGTAQRYGGLAADSTESLMKAKEMLEEQAAIQDAETIGQIATAALATEKVSPYQGSTYELTMAQTYQALNKWFEGDRDSANVLFNQALSSQADAKAKFYSEIERRKKEIKEEEEAEKKEGEGNLKGLQDNVNNPETMKLINERYSNLHHFEAYPEFVNPISTYLAALFKMHDGTKQRGADLLKACKGMMKDNPIVNEDFLLAEGWAQNQGTDKKFVWVIFENGLAPKKEAFRVDIPIIVSKVKYIGVNFPKLVPQGVAYADLTVSSSDSSVRTIPLCSMDRVIQTEYKTRLPLMITKAVVSTTAKAMAQYHASKANKYLGMVTAVGAALLNQADTRAWTSLPKEYQIAKISSPADGTLTITAPDGNTATVKVTPSANSLVWIRVPTAAAPLNCQSMLLSK